MEKKQLEERILNLIDELGRQTEEFENALTDFAEKSNNFRIRYAKGYLYFREKLGKVPVDDIENNVLVVVEKEKREADLADAQVKVLAAKMDKIRLEIETLRELVGEK